VTNIQTDGVAELYKNKGSKWLLSVKIQSKNVNVDTILLINYYSYVFRLYLII